MVPPVIVKVGKYIGFCLYRRSHLLWPSVIGPSAIHLPYIKPNNTPTHTAGTHFGADFLDPMP